MSNPSAGEMRAHIARLLSQKRNYRQEVRELTERYPYVVFYGCGVFFHSIVETWKEYVGRGIDYCCDSDSGKWGKYFCGVKCISPEELMGLKDKCSVFVTIGEFKHVYHFLAINNFVSVNLVYKYDLVSSVILSDLKTDESTDMLCNVYDLLKDKKSQKVFYAIIDRFLGDGKNINIMADVCDENQYYPLDVIKLSDHESFVDAGAFIGDTINNFVGRTRGKFDRIFSFEVDAVNFKLLQKNVKNMPCHDRIKMFNIGILDSECDITYSVDTLQSTIGTGEGKGHVMPLDDVLKDEKVTFIKMDIEGAELQALRGAKKIIQDQKPKLAICVYHDFRHLWEIPLYIKLLVPEYKIYLRHHTNLEYETVCYAV